MQTTGDIGEFIFNTQKKESVFRRILFCCGLACLLLYELLVSIHSSINKMKAAGIKCSAQKRKEEQKNATKKNSETLSVVEYVC